MSIAILLATYNSSRYLEEQIDSLLAQTESDFKLYVRDDGSSDDTLDIVARYSAVHPNITLLNDPTTGRGAMGSFMWMLERVEADYYMFCDHDDVWLPSKVELSLSKIRSIEKPGSPAMLFTDLTVVDGNLCVIAPSMWNYEKLRVDYLSQLRFAVSKNIFTGCTMMINAAAKSVSLPLSPSALMHDSWIGLRVLASQGQVGYIDTPQVLYRQHGDNQVGSTAIDGSFGYYLSKVSNLSKMFAKWRAIYKMACDALGERIPPHRYYYHKMLYLLLRK